MKPLLALNSYVIQALLVIGAVPMIAAQDEDLVQAGIAVMKAKREFVEMEKNPSRDLNRKYEVMVQYRPAIDLKDDRAVAMCALIACEMPVAKSGLVMALAAKYFKDNNKLSSEDEYVQRAVIALNDRRYMSTPTVDLLRGQSDLLAKKRDEKMASLRNIETNLKGLLSQSKYGLQDLAENIQSIQSALPLSDKEFCVAVVRALNSDNVSAAIAMREKQRDADNAYAAQAPNRREKEKANESALDAGRTANIIKKAVEDNTALARSCQSLAENIELYQNEIRKLK